jgi:type VI secretion system protein ImpG
MDDDLLAYYNGELRYVRELGAEFAAKYPKVAARLQLEAGRCEDPHVERLLEGFAFLAARVRKKIDDEFPEITDALLGLLYPHFLRPLPSMTIVQLVPGPDAGEPAVGFTLPRGARLESEPVRGGTCRFQTAYPVTLWPVTVEDARLYHDRVVVPDKPPEAVSLLQLNLRATGAAKFSGMAADPLRFYIDGEPPNVHALYELIFNRVCRVVARGTRAGGVTESVVLGPDAIRPVGFGRDEGMIPYPTRSFPGYRLIQEYFAFPEKFLFFDLVGLGRLRGRGWGDAVEVNLFLDRPPRPEVTADAKSFRLGCTPAVNLFSMVTEPIRLDQGQAEYRVVPDVHRPLATEVYSIDEVVSTSAYLDEPVRFEPFYALRHGGGDRRDAYWYESRRPSQAPGDSGTEVHLSFVDPDFNPGRPAAEAVTVRATCTNRDLPGRLPFGGDRGDFTLEAPGPVSRVRCLRKPTLPLRPRLGRGSRWRLISHLSLNHLSLTDDDEGLESLRAIFRLYDWADSAVTRQQIDGIVRVASRRVAGRVSRAAGGAVCQGIEVTLEFDESHFVGSGVFLLASVLERFLGTYASINSFTQLVARSRQREEILKRWPPRAGDRTLL